MKQCQKCGECCIAIAEEVQQPRTKADYQDMLWYLFHKGITVAIDQDNIWVIDIKSKCKFLDKNNRCKIYKNRPPVCKNYSPNECPKNKKEYKHHFKTIEQLEKYLKKKGLYTKSGT